MWGTSGCMMWSGFPTFSSKALGDVLADVMLINRCEQSVAISQLLGSGLLKSFDRHLLHFGPFDIILLKFQMLCTPSWLIREVFSNPLKIWNFLSILFIGFMSHGN